MKARILGCLAVTLIVPSVGATQTVADDPRVASAVKLLEVWVDAQLAYEDLPGISMGIVHDQELVWSRGFGYAHLDEKVRATPKTMYSICSISKLFTSIGVMQLRDEGKLHLDDPVEKHLAWFKIKEAHPGSAPITIEGILTHSAGLPREAGYPYWTGPEFPFPERQRIMERVASQETLYPAATYYQYSNLGLTLAGEIVAAASGQLYAEYVREHILDPLGLNDTYTEHPDEHRGARFATGYTGRRRDGSREKVPIYHVRGIAPAAGFTSTVEDLARFASWQFRALDGAGQRVLQTNTLKEMQRVHWMDPDWDASRGLGFGVWRDDDKTFVGHGGYCPGYQTQLLLRPQEKVATIFMTNAVGVSSRMYAQRAYQIVAPAINDALDEPGEGRRPDPALAKFVGRYQRFLAGETHVLANDSGLTVVYLPTENPLESKIELKQVGEHMFRRIRDDETLGEEITFEVGSDGRVTRMWRHGNYSDATPPAPTP